MTGPTLLVVADGGPGVGSGHLGRSLALAQAWREAGGEVELWNDPPRPAAWVERFAAAGVPTRVPGTGPTALHAADVVVVDGYGYGAEELAALRSRSKVVVIDDHATGGLRPADLIVDQNLGATAASYGRPPDGGPNGPTETVVLAGVRYTLLRSELVAGRPAVPPDRTAPVRRLLVAMGGDPVAPVTALLAGAARSVAERLGLEVVELRGLPDVSGALAATDLAVSAAGSTVWELALYGVPSVVVAVADNQRRVARAVGGGRVAIDAGDLGSVTSGELADEIERLVADPSGRAALAATAWALIDGHGARRVAAAARATLVGLRRAGPDDARLLWGWANDPGVRSSSFHPEPIAWDTHVAWLERVLARPDSAIWIASDGDGVAVGQVRVEGAASGTAVVDVSVAAERRGQGWAGPLLVAAAQRAEVELGPVGLARLQADVLPENERSGRAFVAADFDRGSDASHEGRVHQTYTRPRHG